MPPILLGATPATAPSRCHPYVSGKYAPEGYDTTGVTSGATTIGHRC